MSTYKKIQRSLKASKKNVFLRQDFDKFGKRSTVNIALERAIEEDFLIRAGYGVYVKTQKDEFGVYPSENSLEVAKTVLDRLNIRYAPSQATVNYNKGATTQVPVNPALKIVDKKRVTRQIGFKKKVVWEFK